MRSDNCSKTVKTGSLPIKVRAQQSERAMLLVKTASEKSAFQQVDLSGVLMLSEALGGHRDSHKRRATPEPDVEIVSLTRAGSSEKASPSVVEREKPPMTHVVGRTGLFSVKSILPRGLGVTSHSKTSNVFVGLIYVGQVHTHTLN